MLLFLLEHAPLERWEHDVLSIIRDEAYYFAPQGQTKIMNEGWATYWHSKIMTEKALDASEIIDYADHHSGTLATSPGQLNPYKLGVELWRDIEDRWNKGRFGKEYDECDSFVERRHWDKRLGLGREKIFEVRKHYNDVTFIDEFLTLEFCGGAEALHLRLQREAPALGDRRARVQEGEGEAPPHAHQLRPAGHRGGGRELREPRRAATSCTSTTAWT